ncbi:MAG: oligosaccharide flippase family protein, partial [Acidimicrobiales bacterium]
MRRVAPLGVALVATTLYYSADSVLIGLFKGSTEVGYYSAAYRVVFACLTIPVVVHGVLLPVVSRLHQSGAPALGATLQGASRGLVWIALPIAVGATMAGETIATSIFGRSYASSALALRLLIWSCVTVSSNAPFAVLLLARRQDRAYMVITLCGAGVNLAANLIMIPAFGLVGAAITTLIAEGTVLLAILWLTRDVSLNMITQSYRRAIPPALIMALALIPVRSSVIAVPVGVAVYLLASAATRALTATDIRRLVGELRAHRDGLE